MKWTFTDGRRPGLPGTRRPVKALIVRMARENPTGMRRRIQDELARLGYRIAASAVWAILHAAGIAHNKDHDVPAQVVAGGGAFIRP